LEDAVFLIARAVTYSTLFIGFLLLFLPSRVLAWSGIVQPPAIGARQITGVILGAFGPAVALWCIVTVVVVGRGPPAPFDPPRRLVVRGPYRFVRNPMYIGAGLALAGAALFYQSMALFTYGAVFLLATHVFVIAYEEPTLRRTFDGEYQAYCRQVPRWLPRL
jgi:protein-S-isoprenylcysteine O-methyltransferase Ste14